MVVMVYNTINVSNVVNCALKKILYIFYPYKNHFVYTDIKITHNQNWKIQFPFHAKFNRYIK